MLIEALLGWGTGNGDWGTGNGEWGMGNGERGMGNGEWGTGNGVQHSGLVGLGDGVEFNLNGGTWDSLSPAQIARVMKGRW